MIFPDGINDKNNQVGNHSDKSNESSEKVVWVVDVESEDEAEARALDKMYSKER